MVAAHPKPPDDDSELQTCLRQLIKFVLGKIERDKFRFQINIFFVSSIVDEEDEAAAAEIFFMRDIQRKDVEDESNGNVPDAYQTFITGR